MMNQMICTIDQVVLFGIKGERYQEKRGSVWEVIKIMPKYGRIFRVQFSWDVRERQARG